MGKAPVERLIDSVVKPVENHPSKTDSGLPYVTHEGVFDLNGTKIRCYVLSDGQRVFDVEDIEALFATITI